MRGLITFNNFINRTAINSRLQRRSNRKQLSFPRFLKQEQWERWWAKRNLVTGFKYRGRLHLWGCPFRCRGPEYHPRIKKFWDCCICSPANKSSAFYSSVTFVCILEHVNNGSGAAKAKRDSYGDDYWRTFSDDGSKSNQRRDHQHTSSDFQQVRCCSNHVCDKHRANEEDSCLIHIDE